MDYHLQSKTAQQHDEEMRPFHDRKTNAQFYARDVKVVLDVKAVSRRLKTVNRTDAFNVSRLWCLLLSVSQRSTLTDDFNVPDEFEFSPYSSRHDWDE